MVATVGSQKAASRRVGPSTRPMQPQMQLSGGGYIILPLLDLLVELYMARGTTLAPAFAELFVQLSRRCYVVLKSAAMHA